MRIPSYRLHKASGQAVVTILGKDIYLGPHDTPESHRRYGEVIATYTSTGTTPLPAGAALTVRDAVDRFRASRLAELEPKEQSHYKSILEELIALLGPTMLAELGAVRYEAVRQQFVNRGWSRKYVNKQCSRLKQLLRWLVAREMYPAERLFVIREVPDLRAGKTVAPELRKVTAVPLELVKQTLPFLPWPVRGLVLFQLHTGARPGEAVIVRRRDINTEGRAILPNGVLKTIKGCWVYTPQAHKTQWRGKPRYVLIGPKGKKALKEFLDCEPDDYLFRPGEVAKATHPGLHYRTDSYGQAVAKACIKAKISSWHPYQLRHLFAATIRDAAGEEAAKEALGHAHLSMTAHYTGTGLERAAAALRKAG